MSRFMFVLFIILSFIMLGCGGEKEDVTKKESEVKSIEKKGDGSEVSAPENAAYTTLAGKPINPEALKGKVLLMDFWATWCGPCKAGMPTMQAIAEHFKDKQDFMMIGVSLDNSIDLAKKYVEEKAFTYHFWFVKDRKEMEKRFKFAGIPALFLIDKEGNIAWQNIGFNASEAEAEKAKIIAETEKVLK